MAEPDAEGLEVTLLLEAIHARYGYDLREYAPSSMRRRVAAALAKSGLAHLGELQHRAIHDAGFFATLLDDLTVRVTEMFRDPSFYRAFRARVVPLLRTYPQLRIWHTGCATGEEVYATAILLAEEGLADRCQIYATDVSPGALEHAKEGVYSAQQLKSFTENYEASGGRAAFQSYFTAAYDRIAMRESLRKNVLFFQHNLVSDHVFGEMHVVFCRNVLIYFSRGLRDRVLAKLAGSLCPGGFLCLGSAERLAAGTPDFGDFVPQERIYRHEP